jgi:hypothetical protein
VLSRIRPTQVALWSFVIAIAHGAGLMLVPIYLGICSTREARSMGQEADATLVANNVLMAMAVSNFHAIARVAAGGIAAWLVYRYAGLQVLSKAWFNLDAFWAISLILVGSVALLISI